MSARIGGAGDVYVESPQSIAARPEIATLGEDSFFLEPYFIRSPHRIHVGRDVQIGAGSILSVVEREQGGRYEPTLRIGDGCRIGRELFVTCTGEITIGDRVGMASRVCIGDCYREYEDVETPIAYQPMSAPEPVRIGDDAALGIGAIVMPGVTIGRQAYVGGGSVVTRDVPDRCVVFGNPARIVRSWDEATGQWRLGG